MNGILPAGCRSKQNVSVDELRLPPGFRYDVIVRWGDPILFSGEEFDGMIQDPVRQAKQFGYNCDFVAFMPLSGGQCHQALLVVNHEFTKPTLMFPDEIVQRSPHPRWMIETEWAATGLSVVEVCRSDDGRWSYHQQSSLNRRVMANTPLKLSGPAAGHPWLMTSYDSTGSVVMGTLGNCGGGVTTWGTVLSCEENFHMRFGGKLDPAGEEAVQEIHHRYGLPGKFPWHQHDDRFDLSKEPHEPFRFGWIVEIDPYDPHSIPVKRTALGRLKHECAPVVVDEQNRVIVYTNDDEPGGCLYKFISALRVEVGQSRMNSQILDDGTLHVARLHDDGTGEWIPLTYGVGPLNPSNGFRSQAEVLINTRGAADQVGASPMDRPEGLEVDQSSKKIYAAITGHSQDAGHVLEISEERGDFSSTRFVWQVLIRGGQSSPQAAAQDLNDNEWFVSPDNILADQRGYLWVGTDGQTKLFGVPENVYVIGLQRNQRRMMRRVLTCPMGAEPTGMAFSPDHRALFMAIQHPGDGPDATFNNPTSRWPDFHPSQPPRPSVIAISKVDGSPISGNELLNA